MNLPEFPDNCLHPHELMRWSKEKTGGHKGYFAKLQVVKRVIFIKMQVVKRQKNGNTGCFRAEQVVNKVVKRILQVVKRKNRWS
ncbi:hypothetical protein [Methanomicrobium mobile]|uniref:hypothetical protein n=1 Tax=Methanomicrobium mobile TaxID=2205 RepID=UPI0012F6967E|nr:hypothetical protein [Methanomicrobium mobile]